MTALFPSLALLKKELLGSLRSTPMFLFIGVFCGLMIYFFLSGYPRLFRYDGFQELAFISINQLKELGQNFSWAAFLLIPGVAASSLAAEKEDGSFEMLLMTLIRPGGIVAAKLVNVLGLYLLALVAVLPILASALFTPGVDQTLVARMFSVLAFQAGSLAAIGMFFSTVCPQTLTAIFWSYLTSLVAMGWLFFGMRTMGEILDAPGLEAAMDSLFQALCVQYLIRDLDSAKSITDFYTLNSAIIIFGFYFSLVLVRRPPATPSAPSAKLIDDPALLAARRRSFPYYLIDPLARRRPIPDRFNPVLIRELRYRAWGKAPSIILFAIIATAISLLVNNSQRQTYFHYGDEADLLIFEILFGCAILPAILTRSVMSGSDRGELEMLGMTGLTPERIMWGKLFGGMAAVAPLLVAALIFVGKSCFFLGGPFWSIKIFLIFYGVFSIAVFLTALSSLAVAGIFKRPIMSMLASYLVVALVLWGPYPLLLFTRLLLGDWVFEIKHTYIDHSSFFIFPFEMLYDDLQWYPGSHWGWGRSLDSARPYELIIPKYVVCIAYYYVLLRVLPKLAVSRFRINPRSG